MFKWLRVYHLKMNFKSLKKYFLKYLFFIKKYEINNIDNQRITRIFYVLFHPGTKRKPRTPTRRRPTPSRSRRRPARSRSQVTTRTTAPMSLTIPTPPSTSPPTTPNVVRKIIPAKSQTNGQMRVESTPSGGAF